jgi:hypothetical protein
VTFRPWDNVYVYAVTTLWVAYGLALFATIVSIGFGLISIARNGAGFTNDFSTIVRQGRRTTTFHDQDEIQSRDDNSDSYPMVGRKTLPDIDTSYKPGLARSFTGETAIRSNESIRSSRASFDNDDEWPLPDSKSRGAFPG